MCPRGSFGPGGYAPCTPCPPGRFGSTSLQASCKSCPAGRFGSSSGTTTALCSGPCAAGYSCPVGSANMTAYACPAGTYSPPGAGVCTPCPAGRFGSIVGAANSSAGCAGSCEAGYMCPAGSSSGTAVQCPAGTYSLDGAEVCTPCPAGVYGELPGLTSPACSAPCAPGYYGSEPGRTYATCTGSCSAGFACPAGSTSPTASLCSAGQYSTGGQGNCTRCAAGQFGPTLGAISQEACLPCAAGFYGATSGLPTAQCSGVCPAGYFCQGVCLCAGL